VLPNCRAEGLADFDFSRRIFNAIGLERRSLFWLSVKLRDVGTSAAKKEPDENDRPH
jgi:hypothetical protein